MCVQVVFKSRCMICINNCIVDGFFAVGVLVFVEMGVVVGGRFAICLRKCCMGWM